MPLGWKGESGERRVHHRPSAMRAVELVVEEERATAVQEARYLKPTPGRSYWTSASRAEIEVLNEPCFDPLRTDSHF
jgi:hypothetical protein